MITSFTKQQTCVVLGCVLTYMAAYLNRLNLSAALSNIIVNMQISPTSAGMLQTCFAAVYAIGQLMNGMIVDRVNPVRYMLLGLSGTALCNFLLGVSGQYWMLLVLCLLNGAFQSMLWTPIVRLIAMHFPDGRMRIRTNFALSMTLAIGHLGAWGISGLVSGWVGWRFSFIVPACIAALILPLVFSLLRSEKRETAAGKAIAFEKQALGGALRCFAKTGFLFVLLCCVLYGFAKDGIVTWSPEILRTISPELESLTASFSLIIPVINVFGILFGYYLRSHSHDNNRIVVALMLPLTALFCLLPLFFHSLPITALSLGFACACLYGMNPMLTNLIPMEYDKMKCVGLAAGVADSFIYVGAALSGVIGGTIYENGASKGLFWAWILAALVGMVLAWIATLTGFTNKKNSQNEA